MTEKFNSNNCFIISIIILIWQAKIYPLLVFENASQLHGTFCLHVIVT